MSAYKAVFNGNHLRHGNYTIDDDGRFHSTADGKFVTKGRSSYIPTSQLSNEDLQLVNKRANLEKKYNENYPSPRKQASDLLDSTGRGLNQASNTVKGIRLKEKKNPRADLSKLSDAELRQILNREQMERQYDQYFNSPVENKGQKFVDNLGTVLGLAAAAVTITGGILAISSNVKKK